MGLIHMASTLQKFWSPHSRVTERRQGSALGDNKSPLRRLFMVLQTNRMPQKGGTPLIPWQRCSTEHLSSSPHELNPQ